MSPGNRWFLVGPRRAGAPRVFAFPFAGGGSSVYRAWADRLGDVAELWSVRLPGRELRLRETPYRRLSALVTDLADELAPYVHEPFVFYGHSMGALISFELCREFRRRGRPLPRHLIVSGRPAPHIAPPRSDRHEMSDEEFLEELRGLGGTQTEILQDEELCRLLMPCLRADFELCETYAYAEEEPLSCSISALGGTLDADVPAENIAAWKTHTRGEFRSGMMSGGHFFINDHSADVVGIVAEAVRASC